MTSTADGADRGHRGAPTGATGHASPRAPTRVSVIMPVRNAAETVTEQLAALARQDWPGDWEVVVADNGSRDATAERVTAFADRLPLQVVDAAEQRGISAARNHGIAAATGDLLLFCDADDVVTDDWVSEMVAAARHADLVGGRIDATRLNPPQVREARPAPQPGRLATAHGHLPYATGASLAVWADVVADLGGFCEGFRTCGDDIDLSWRAQRAGYRLVYAPKALTHYRYRAHMVDALAQAFRYGIADTMLARRHRDHVGRPPLRRHARPLRDLPKLLQGPAARRSWTWSTWLRLGGLVGAVHPATWRLPRVEADPVPSTRGHKATHRPDAPFPVDERACS